jgi:type III pantothenate kinase
MILLVDLGNTRIKWGLLEGGCVVDKAGVAHSGAHVDVLLDRHWRMFSRPAQVVVANVAGETVAAAFGAWCWAHWRLRPRFIRPRTTAHGVTNAYAQPARLGADRWAALIGAWRHCGGPICIVGCGTAVTVDALDAEGRHLGGAIMPGLTAMRQALYQMTAGIPDEGEGELVLLARDTRSAVTTGAMYAVSGGIDRMNAELDMRLGGMRRLLTGGDAAQLSPLLHHTYRIVPDLVLKGLAILTEEDVGEDNDNQ